MVVHDIKELDCYLNVIEPSICQIRVERNLVQYSNQIMSLLPIHLVTFDQNRTKMALKAL